MKEVRSIFPSVSMGKLIPDNLIVAESSSCLGKPVPGVKKVDWKVNVVEMLIGLPLSTASKDVMSTATSLPIRTTFSKFPAGT